MNVLSFIKFDRYASLEQLCMILCIIYKWVIFIAFSFLRVWDRVFFNFNAEKYMENIYRNLKAIWNLQNKGNHWHSRRQFFFWFKFVGFGGGGSLYFLNLERSITLDSISPLYLIKPQWIFKAYKNCTYVMTWCNEAWKKMKTKNEIKY